LQFPLVFANDLRLKDYKELLSSVCLGNELGFACAVCGATMPVAVESVADHLRLRHQINLLQYHRLFAATSASSIGTIVDCCLHRCPLCADAFFSARTSFLYHMKSSHAVANAKDYKSRFGDITLVTSYLSCPVCEKVFSHFAPLHVHNKS
jgi:uncharacterized C2H2 Zn-finger protein